MSARQKPTGCHTNATGVGGKEKFLKIITHFNKRDSSSALCSGLSLGKIECDSRCGTAATGKG